MLPFGKDKTIKEWKNWIKKRETLRNEIYNLRLDLDQSKELRKSKGRDAFWMGHEALETLGIDTSRTPENDLPGASKTRDMLNASIDRAKALRQQGRGADIDIDIGKCRAMHTKLDALLQECSTAQKNLESLELQLETTKERLDEHEDNPPEAGHAALKAFDDELAALDKERSRVEGAINNQTPNGEETDQAERDVVAAQEKLDALEAAAALGESSDEAQQKASGALTRARNKLDASQAAKARREAAKRGLIRKLEEIEQKRTSLANERALAAQEVYLDDMADAENKLLDMLTHADLYALVKKINETRTSYNQAWKQTHDHEGRRWDSPHGQLKIKIDLSHLIAIENRKDINDSGISI